MSFATYITPKRLEELINTDDPIVCCGACGSYYELTEGQLQELTQTGSILVSCSECENDFYIEVNDNWKF